MRGFFCAGVGKRARPDGPPLKRGRSDVLARGV